MVGNIFDNLTASGDAEPTIVVSMQREDVNAGKLDDIITWVEETYNVSEKRALGGVSMGSVAATKLWQENPGQFAYYAFLSGGDPAIRGAYQDPEKYTYVDLSEDILAAMRKATYFLGGVPRTLTCIQATMIQLPSQTWMPGWITMESPTTRMVTMKSPSATTTGPSG